MSDETPPAKVPAEAQSDEEAESLVQSNEETLRISHDTQTSSEEDQKGEKKDDNKDDENGSLPNDEATSDSARVHLPLNVATYNVQGLGDSTVSRNRPKQVENLLMCSFPSFATYRLVQGKQALDVILIQECGGDDKKTFLESMRNRGYDHVTSGQHAILWQRATMERVAPASGNEPDYVWCTKRGNVLYLDEAWGKYDANDDEGRKIAEDYKRTINEVIRMASSSTSSPKKIEKIENNFFHYPPISVLLRRTFPATKTMFVFTSVHTPGSNSERACEQLSREVKWLLGPHKYAAVMSHMEKRIDEKIEEFGNDACKNAWKKISSLFNPEGVAEVVHSVIGDFNTQNFASDTLSSDKKYEGLGIRVDITPFFSDWAMKNGKNEAAAVPSTKDNFPDAAYIWRPNSLKGSLFLEGSVMDVKQNEKKNDRDKPKFGPSDHKPLFLAITEHREGSDVSIAGGEVGGEDAALTAASMLLFSQLESIKSQLSAAFDTFKTDIE